MKNFEAQGGYYGFFVVVFRWPPLELQQDKLKENFDMKNNKDNQLKGIKVIDVTGVSNKVTSLNKEENLSIDMKLLEMENKLKALREAQEERSRERAEKAKLTNKLSNLFESVMDVIVEPKSKLMKIKPIKVITNYFFLIEDEEYIEGSENIQESHEYYKGDIVKEGNVIYLNKEFK